MEKPLKCENFSDNRYVVKFYKFRYLWIEWLRVDSTNVDPNLISWISVNSGLNTRICKMVMKT